MSENQLLLVQIIAQAIYEKKGLNILTLDLRGVSSTNDYLVIAEGNVDRHVLAIASEVEKVLKERGERPLYTEGRSNGDWVVIDYGSVVVHLFMPGLREHYSLEKHWSEAKILDIPIDVTQSQLGS